MVFIDLASKSVVTVSSGLASKPAMTVSGGLASKPAAMVSSGLASKPDATVFSSLASKLVATVSPGLASKPVVGFLVGPQNKGGGGLPGLGLKTVATVWWFEPQKHCHTPFREIGNEASIRVPRMFKSHAWQQYDKQMQCY
jgi:hypothetical protein